MIYLNGIITGEILYTYNFFIYLYNDINNAKSNSLIGTKKEEKHNINSEKNNI
jgi:hypothetical protein